MATMKSTVKDMKQLLFHCSDNVTVIKTKVEFHSTEVRQFGDKCKEARTRRNNMRIMGIPTNTPATNSTVSNLL